MAFMSLSNFSVNSILQDKTILVVGGSGFISKVWLSMILQFVPSVKKIFVLVRPNKQIDGVARFEKIYLTSPVFDNIRNIYGTNLFNSKKLEVISGDACHNQFCMDNEKYTTLLNEVDIVLNFAADLRFIAPLDQMLKSNVLSVDNICDFILKSASAKLLHISTCYVAGVADGIVSEKPLSQKSPNGTLFSAQEEFNFGMQECLGARNRNATNQELTSLGILRAERLGWPNTYTYTKALGEIILSEKLNDSRFCIFRPSIVESAEKYPFPGWNEDFNGTAPFIQMLSSPYRLLVAKPNHNLDIIPVDYVAKGLTIAASALLTENHSKIYQCSTSSINPLSVKHATDFIFNYFKNKNSNGLVHYILPNPKPMFITPKHFLSSSNIKNFERRVTLIYNKIKTEKKSTKFFAQTGIDGLLDSFRRKTKKIDLIMNAYKPFIYDYNYTFTSENLLKHRIIEEEFLYSPKNIEWDHYWKIVHIPGLKQWCLPRLNTLNKF
ncbi:MAG: hypothetical protein DCC88_02055 [Spirobacillus cienkowskii]|jgi:nucleoside-diphosphate-sugar epimerase|uniref:Thioester reductase (TE) domain-containing protein n=2 Tax=Spirobacillus cienkowskii TaxID=495820 RepID=A0A369KZ49_9BACT|nr:MAG: hypothetical protein DCC88_02055 [Spirobacillus cienkowskii]